MSKLYVIDNSNKLVGKTIAYIEMNRYANPTMVITTDGGIMMQYIEELEEGEYSLENYSKARIESELFQNSSRIKERVIKSNIFLQSDFDELLASQIELHKQEQEQHKQHKEQREREEFERLKAKFEVQP
jgi:hypothetical protein